MGSILNETLRNPSEPVLTFFYIKKFNSYLYNDFFLSTKVKLLNYAEIFHED